MQLIAVIAQIKIPQLASCTCRSGKRKLGSDVIQELQAAGVHRFKDLARDRALVLGKVYDGYNRKLRSEHKMDFDDILHHCLALVHNFPEVTLLL